MLEESRRLSAIRDTCVRGLPFRQLPENRNTARLRFAEQLLKHYPKEKKEAVEHLNFVITEFRSMKMQTYLEKALRHKEILKA